MSEIHKINISKEYKYVLNTCRFCGKLPIVYRYMQNRRLQRVIIKCREHSIDGNICELNSLNLVGMMSVWNKKQWENDREILISLEDVDRVLYGSGSMFGGAWL